MKLNLDCCRDILLTIESQTERTDINFYDFLQLLPQYSEFEIEYCLEKLYEANYIHLICESFNNSSSELLIICVEDLTFQGHEFLENIRSKNVWDKTKNICGNIGSFSLELIKTVASDILIDIVNKKLNI